jgi:hypothetical protein
VSREFKDHKVRRAIREMWERQGYKVSLAWMEPLDLKGHGGFRVA